MSILYKSSNDEQYVFLKSKGSDVNIILFLSLLSFYIFLGIERIFLKKFQDALVESCIAVTAKTRWRGIVLGLGIYVPFMSYCSATLYGTTLVAYEGLPYNIVLL